MGLRLNIDLDTTAGPSKEVYVKIENIQLNRTFGKVNVGLTYWMSKEISDAVQDNSQSHFPKGQVGDKVIYYEDKYDEGKEISLPTYLSFDMKKPVQIKIPIYEEKTHSEEVPYVGFDENGDEITKWRTEKVTEKVLIGERLDVIQVIDLDIESRLLSWCYGQVTAALGKVLPIENIENY